MSDMPTREELDAKIDALRSRTDGHFHELCARLDGLSMRMDALEARMDKLEARMDKLEARMDRLEHQMMDLKRSIWMSNLATIVSVIAIATSSYFATQQSNQAIVQATIAAIEAGRASAAQVPPPAPPARSP
jgi:chromosome segregation ATPase